MLFNLFWEFAGVFLYYLVFVFFTVDVAFFTNNNLPNLVFNKAGGKNTQCDEKELNE